MRSRSPSRRDVLRALVASPLLFIDCKSVEKELALEYLHDFSRAERSAIESTATAALREVRPRLPQLPAHLTLRVDAGTDVIPETGESATAYPPATIAWTVEPARGVVATVAAQLRFTLHHELHHLVRDAAIPRTTLMDHVVAEGLGTAFERDAAGAKPPWGEYPANVADWVRELEALPPDANVAHWLYERHPDGRRWVGLRAGTFLVDRAMSALGRSAAELVERPTAELLRAGHP